MFKTKLNRFSLLLAVICPGKAKFKDFAVASRKAPWRKSYTTFDDRNGHYSKVEFGHLSLRLKLIQENRDCVNSVLSGAKVSVSNMNVIPIEAEFKTQLKAWNVYSSFFIGNCVTSTSVNHLESEADSRIERYFIAPGYDSLVLKPLDSQSNEADVQKPMQSALMHQFKRHTKRKKAVQREGEDEQWENIVIFYFYENQRSAGLLNFSGSYLSAFDRDNYSDETGYFRSPYCPQDVKFKPPEGYVWDHQHFYKWTIDFEYTETDNDGWSYGIDFNHVMQRLRRGKSTSYKYLQNVRRRRWQRIAVSKDDLTSKILPSASNNGGRRVKFGTLSRGLATQDFSVKTSVCTVYRNERRGIDMSWSSGNLFSVERSKFSNEDCTDMFDVDDVNDIPPPLGYVWADDSEWEVDKEYLPTDSNGWVYGIDFPSIERNFRSKTSNTRKALFSCRRQRLKRRMIECEGPSCLAVSDGQHDQIKDKFFADSLPSRCRRSNGCRFDRDDGFANDKFKILSFCRERENSSGNINIPWAQVKNIDVITPSVLSVTVIVHRYIGNEHFAEVDMELFIGECSADKLCLLMQDRLQLLPIREDLKKLINSGTLTGNCSEEYRYRVPESSDYAATSPSLGSVISKNLFHELQSINTARHGAHVLSSNNDADEAINMWVQQKDKHLKTLKLRLKLFAQLLLASGLDGPDFDKVTAEMVAQSDQRISKMILCGVSEKGSIVDNAKDAVSFLLESAEARICDYALSGWEHQGKVLEDIMSTLVNGYYLSMIEILGYFFDSEDVLTSIKGNGGKLALINFILEHDGTLSMIADSSMRPYKYENYPPSSVLLIIEYQDFVGVVCRYFERRNYDLC